MQVPDRDHSLDSRDDFDGPDQVLVRPVDCVGVHARVLKVGAAEKLVLLYEVFVIAR